MKVTFCVWASRAGFSKEHRATLSHHATAVHGSDIVYSRELQSTAIRKLQMLLKKIRVGVEGGANSEQVREMTAPYDTLRVSAVRTPVLQAGAPQTPVPDATTLAQPSTPNAAVVVANDDIDARLVECKEEDDLHKLCEKAFSDSRPFGEKHTVNEMIESDSSSGSSSSDSSSDSDSSDDEHFANAIPSQAYSETVPAGRGYVVRKKSKIMHCTASNGRTTKCKAQITDNFFRTERVIKFRFPRCVRCFPKDHNRLTSYDDVINFLDDAAKKRKHADS